MKSSLWAAAALTTLIFLPLPSRADRKADALLKEVAATFQAARPLVTDLTVTTTVGNVQSVQQFRDVDVEGPQECTTLSHPPVFSPWKASVQAPEHPLSLSVPFALTPLADYAVLTPIPDYIARNASLLRKANRASVRYLGKEMVGGVSYDVVEITNLRYGYSLTQAKWQGPSPKVTETAWTRTPVQKWYIGADRWIHRMTAEYQEEGNTVEVETVVTAIHLQVSQPALARLMDEFLPQSAHNPNHKAP